MHQWKGSGKIFIRSIQPPDRISKPMMISLNRRTSWPRFSVTVIALIACALLSFGAGTMSAQKRKVVRHGVICGNPTVPCKTSATFPPNDLPFRIPASASIYDTDLFYAVMLKSMTVPEDNCDRFIPESERLAAQRLFAVVHEHQSKGAV